jgi:DNA polymerase-3 subunit gamma/tau
VSCVSITEGTSLDVLELDAASHNSIDDIRDIRLSVTTVASTATSKRVFVLDEAHMLSKAAGNALLKTLEEPPEHVHFVLATTEPYKLLDTIRSRSQRFDFHPVPIEDLAGHLSVIAEREGYQFDAGALLSIARHAGGSVRDSLSLLEQVAALGAGTVEVGGVRRALGLADSEAFMRLVEAVAAQDAKAALELVAELSADGVDLRRFVAESVAFFRGAFLAHYAPNLAEIADEPPEVYGAWRRAAELVTSGDVLRAVDLLGEALIRLREGREERLMTELALIKLTRPETASDNTALLSRIERLERGQPRPVVSEPPLVTAEKSTPTDPAEGVAQETDTQSVGAKPAGNGSEISFEQLQKVWPGLFGSLRDVLGARRWAFFREAVPVAVEGDTITLEVAHDFHLQSLQEDDVVSSIVATRAGDLLGSEVKIQFRSRQGTQPDSETREIDLGDLEERSERSTDPTSLLVDELGAEEVEE